MLCRLLIGLARFDLQNFAVGHWPGVAMQTAQFWTVLIMLSHASSGTHRPTVVAVVCRGSADCKQSALAEGCPKKSHSPAPFDVIPGSGEIINALGSERTIVKLSV